MQSMTLPGDLPNGNVRVWHISDERGRGTNFPLIGGKRTSEDEPNELAPQSFVLGGGGGAARTADPESQIRKLGLT
jgi:hypothetical protein